MPAHLTNNFAVGLVFGTDSLRSSDKLAEIIGIGFDREFLGHEADGCVFDIGDFVDILFHLSGTIGAFEILKLKYFAHNILLSVWSLTDLFAQVRHALSQHGVDMVIGKGVDGVFAVALKFHKTGLLEHTELVRRGTLRCADDLGNVGHAKVFPHECIEDLDARSVRECFELIGEIVEQFVFGHCFKQTIGIFVIAINRAVDKALIGKERFCFLYRIG